jgi:gliding motility-associated protein GldC
MNKSEINITVELDENRIPNKIFWDATENPNEGINETKAISLGVWDQYHKGLLGINLWTKDMPVDEMNHFTVDLIGNLAQMIKDSTNDPKVISILHEAGKQITNHLDEQAKLEEQQQQQQ